MPGVFYHFHIAKHLLERCWKEDTSWQPSRSYFLAGAVGPDLGYLCGQHWMSDCAHYHKTALLPQDMLVHARDECERAYVYGWFSHVLADIHVHPIVNRAAARYAQSDFPLTFADNSGLHISIEQGLDTLYVNDGSRKDVDCVLDWPIDLIQSSFHRAFNLQLCERKAQSWNQIAWKRLRYAVQLAELNRCQLRIEESHRCRSFDRFVYALARLLTKVQSQSSLYALLHPVTPDPLLKAESESAIATIESDFRLALRSNFQNLLDYNLDLGEPTQSARASGYSLAMQTAKWLSTQQSKR